jgi:hypothetical protein
MSAVVADVNIHELLYRSFRHLATASDSSEAETAEWASDSSEAESIIPSQYPNNLQEYIRPVSKRSEQS